MRIEIAGTEIPAIVSSLRKGEQVIIHLVIIDLSDGLNIVNGNDVELFDDDDAEVFSGFVHRAITGRIGAFGLGRFWSLLCLAPDQPLPDPALVCAFSDIAATRLIEWGLDDLLAEQGINYREGFPKPVPDHAVSGTLTLSAGLIAREIEASRFEVGQIDLWFRQSTNRNIFPVTIKAKYQPFAPLPNGDTSRFWQYAIEWDNGGGKAPQVEEHRLGFTEEEVDR